MSLTAEEFNRIELEEGRTTLKHFTSTVRCYQRENNLLVDGKLGHETRTDIEVDWSETLADLTWGIALKELGRGEEGANNKGPEIDKYRRNLKVVDPWCAWFVSWCIEQACIELGVPMFIPPGLWKRNWRGAKRLFKTVKKHGGIEVEIPRRGDLVLWNRGAFNSWKGHIGIVNNRKGNKFTSIEGNKGAYPAEVDIFNHTLGEAQLLGFVRLPQLLESV